MLQIFITNNIRVRGASVPLRAALTKALTLDNPAYVERKQRRRPTWGIDAKIQLYVYSAGDLIIPRGFKKQLIEILVQQGIQPEKVIAERTTEGAEVDFGKWNPAFEIGASPREYQIPAVEAAVANDGVLVAPAGSGKTAMGMRYIQRKGRPAIWLAHTIDLVNQAKEAAEKYMDGVGRVGVLGGGKMDYGDGKLIIATVQTLAANPHIVEGLNDIIGTVVVDEAHHFPAPAFVDVVGLFKAKNILGVTATPDRKDRLECYLYTGIGPKCHEIPRDGLYDTGALIKPEVKFVFTAFDYEQASDVRRFTDEELLKGLDPALHNDKDVVEGFLEGTRAAISVDAGGDDMDYSALLKALIADEKRAKLIAETIVENASLGPAIVITESVRYCYILQELVERMAAARYRGLKLRTAVVHGGITKYTWHAAGSEYHAHDTDEGFRWNKRLNRMERRVEQYTDAEMEAWQVTPTQRKEILQDAKDRKIDILFATQLAREGLDMPHLTVGYMAMPKRGDASGSKNGAAVEQEIGRIMRPDPKNPNKKALWVDFVDYNVGVFQSQYQSRRSVYRRLDLKLPKKPKTERENIADFLSRDDLFDLPL